MAAQIPTFGSRLKAAREARGLSQLETAVGAGVDPSSLSRWERDKVKPGLEEIRLLCTFLQVSADDLLGLTRGGPAPDPVNNAEWQEFLQRPVAALARDHGVLDAVHRAQLQDPNISVATYEALAWHLVKTAVEQSAKK